MLAYQDISLTDSLLEGSLVLDRFLVVVFKPLLLCWKTYSKNFGDTDSSCFGRHLRFWDSTSISRRCSSFPVPRLVELVTDRDAPTRCAARRAALRLAVASRENMAPAGVGGTRHLTTSNNKKLLVAPGLTTRSKGR